MDMDKRRQRSRRKAAVLAISYLSAAALALGLWSASLCRRVEIYERYAANQYHHAYDELVTAVSEMDAALQKTRYATSPAMVASLCTDVFGKAMAAQLSLSALPVSSQELEQTSGFISRVGDYALTLSRSAAGGSEATEEQRQTLRALSDSASVLSVSLTNLQTDVLDGVLRLDELITDTHRLAAAENSRPSLGGSLQRMEQEFPEIPSLVYDGPFSQHLLGREPRALLGLPTVDEETARQTAAQFSGIARSKLYLSGIGEGELPFYLFTAELSSGSVSIAVTRQGGRVLHLLNGRQPAEGKLDDKQALTIAHRFLDERGFTGLTETYRIRQGNIITFNFAYRQDQVLCYADLVKVSVAADTGAVCGFESHGYLSSHQTRSLPVPAVTAEQARAAVPADLDILATQLALVPSPGGEEVLCHEFKCADGEDRHCLIYVNAHNGQQHRILLLLEDETGSLTL